MITSRNRNIRADVKDNFQQDFMRRLSYDQIVHNFSSESKTVGWNQMKYTGDCKKQNQ